MTEILKNKFDGSIAEELRTFKTNEHESSDNFELSKSHILEPITDTIVETSTGDPLEDIKLTDVILDATDNASLVALGKKSSASSNVAFFTSSAIGNAWTIRATRSAGIVMPNTLIAYNGLAYALEILASDTNLIEFTNNTTTTLKGTVTGTNQSNLPKPFIHPEDTLLYIGSGYTLGIWDGTTMETFNTLIPTDKTITSFTDYGTYLAIGVKPTTNIGNSLTYLWGRDTSKNTAQGYIDWGFGNLLALENIGNILVAITLVINSNTTIAPKLQLKTWSGGEVRTVQEIDLPSGIGTVIPSYVFKARTKNSVYFTLSADTNIYKVTKNREGVFTLNKERQIANGSSPSNINGFSLINDVMWVGYNIAGGATNAFFRNKITTAVGDYTNTSVYKTTINPNMYLNDRYKNKKLTSIRLAITGIASGTAVLKYSVDGSTMTALISETTTGAELVYESSSETDGKPLLEGREFQFQVESTGGVKIKEIAYYYKTVPTLN